MTDPIILETKAGIGRITLNRPKALHALNLRMCEIIFAALKDWARDPDIQIVVMDHMPGTRGFCAGGDIAMLRESGMGDGHEARAFFALEYRLNAAIKAFPKPYLALMNGITMGGGVGLSVHGGYRVATENTVFAMPETGIGLFPDVGGGWFLPRLPGALGTWLALTGARLKGATVAAAGIATHYIPSEYFGALDSDLADCARASNADEALKTGLNRLAQPLGEPSYSPHIEIMDRCFSAATVEDIIANLKAAGTDWATQQIDILQTKSPETLKLALRQLREGGQATSFEAHMQMEYRIGWRKVQSPDFIEGVRAVIVDKDHAPDWQPATLDAVDEAHIQRFFEPLGDQELHFD